MDLKSIKSIKYSDNHHLNDTATSIFALMKSANMVKELNESLQPQINQLLNHSLYGNIKNPEQLRCFMEHHVFAVWDFMSLLKSLQNKLTRTKSPWIPKGNPETRYLINEIVLAEESDLNFFGKRQSHFEMYLDAMENSGASSKRIEEFLWHVGHGTDVFLIIAISDLPHGIKKFLINTFDIISEGKPHKIAAAFTFGREGLIPGMFTNIIKNIQQNFPQENLKLLTYYFERHIELDADEHGPMANKMVEDLCRNDSLKWEEARETSIRCLESRILLWDGIEEELLKTTSV